MDALSLTKRMIDEGYPLTLIAKQCQIPYMDLYRSINKGRPIKEDEALRIKRFAIVQPFMEE